MSDFEVHDTKADADYKKRLPIMLEILNSGFSSICNVNLQQAQQPAHVKVFTYDEEKNRVTFNLKIEENYVFDHMTIKLSEQLCAMLGFTWHRVLTNKHETVSAPTPPDLFAGKKLFYYV